MSKRNKQQMMYQPASPAKKRAPGGKSNLKTNPRNAQASGGKVRVFNRPAQPTVNPNVQPVRIGAIVIAVAALAGAIAWVAIVLQSNGTFTPLQVVGLVALGFIAGLALLIAFRTAEVVTRVRQIYRERARR